MNWGKVIMELIVFYSVMLLLFVMVGNAIQTVPEIGEISGQADADDYITSEYVENYHKGLENSMKQAGINKFMEGEYGLNDSITVHEVWHATKSLGSDKRQVDIEDIGGIPGYIKEFSEEILHRLTWGWYSRRTDEDIYKKYIKNDVAYIAEGEPVYIYPMFTIDLNRMRTFGEISGIPYNPISGLLPLPLPNVQQYVVVRAWDVYGTKLGTFEWEPDAGGIAAVVAELNSGDMTKYDLYYVIDFIHSDTNIEDYLNVEDWLNRGAVKVFERWGGHIQGDEHIDPPTTVEPHPIPGAGKNSAMDQFLTVIGGAYIAFDAFQGYGVLTLAVWGLVFSPLIFLGGYIIYTEAKSFIPLISGD